MKSSFDIGSELDGCADVKAYVPGRVTRVYFAHPVTTYDTALEFECDGFIRRYVGEVDIVNPNSTQHEAGYKKLRVLKSDPMEYFVRLANTCDVCVFLPFSDKRVGAGVWKEIKTFFDRFGEVEARVWEYDTNQQSLIARSLEYFMENPRRVLSVQETRQRIAEYRKATPPTC